LGLVSADEAKNLLSSVEPTNRRIALAASWVAEPVKVEPIAEPIVAEAVVKPAPEVVATAGALALISAVEKTEVEVQAAAEAAEQAKEEELVLNVAETLTQRHYAPLVVGQIYKSLTYPSRAIDNNQQGTVRIGLAVHRSGELLSVTATQKSDYRLLNQAALKAVKKLLHSQPCPTV
jgi:TonB family protein